MQGEERDQARREAEERCMDLMWRGFKIFGWLVLVTAVLSNAWLLWLWAHGGLDGTGPYFGP